MFKGLNAQFERRYPTGPVVRANIQQPVDQFSVTVLFGPSGCGKTTVLRCLAGLDQPTSGFIRCGGERWYEAKPSLCLPPQQRKVGFLFQDYALFPHRTVSQNIGYSLRARSKAEREAIVADLLDRFQLAELQHRLPHQISGGQQQRAALARVLASRPRLLLLDEPLSALDETLRRTLRTQLRQLLSAFSIPVLVVTHDRFEAMALADQIIVMNDGQILQSGSVEDIFSRPVDSTVARIVGMETVVPGEIVSVAEGLATVLVQNLRLLAVAPEQAAQRVHVCIKGEDVMLQRGTGTNQSARNQFPARITSVTPEGPLLRIGLDCGFELSALVSRSACEDLNLQQAERVTACVKASSVHLIPAKSRQ